jgi:hypothetical protein
MKILDSKVGFMRLLGYPLLPQIPLRQDGNHVSTAQSFIGAYASAAKLHLNGLDYAAWLALAVSPLCCACSNN